MNYYNNTVISTLKNMRDPYVVNYIDDLMHTTQVSYDEMIGIISLLERDRLVEKAGDRGVVITSKGVLFLFHFEGKTQRYKMAKSKLYQSIPSFV